MGRRSGRSTGIAGAGGITRIAASVLGAATLAAGALTGAAGTAGAAPQAPDLGSLSADATIPVPDVARIIAGQHVVYSYHGLTPPPALFDAIRSGEAAGVIFFSENISSPQQLHEVADQLQAAAMQSPVPLPLLLMTDQEGGPVRRLEFPGANQPVESARDVGASADPAAAGAAAGHGAAQTLHAAGLNTNLAPVLGVYRQPDDFLDNYQRSFSQDPAVVGEAGAAFIAAQQADGIVSTAKHFPGLGAAPTDANTDMVPVTLDVPAGEIRTVDEAPYRNAIAAGVDMIMPSWATYPALDAGNPAGMSSTILRGDLRGDLGYQGVIISDALEAGSLEAYGGPAQRAESALAAGQDIALCSGKNVAQGVGAVDGIAAAIGDGGLNIQDVLASTMRVLQLRASLL